MDQNFKKREMVHIDNTNFIYRKNFSGDPSKDKYGNSARRANIIIPTFEEAQYISSLGIGVKETKPRDGEEEGFKPVYYMPVIVNYDSSVAKSRPPMVYLVTGNKKPVLLDEDTIGLVDQAYVVNVKASIEIVYLAKYDRYAAYVRTMYVFQDDDDDPWAAEFEDRFGGDNYEV